MRSILKYLLVLFLPIQIPLYAQLNSTLLFQEDETDGFTGTEVESTEFATYIDGQIIAHHTFTNGDYFNFRNYFEHENVRCTSYPTPGIISPEKDNYYISKVVLKNVDMIENNSYTLTFSTNLDLRYAIPSFFLINDPDITLKNLVKEDVTFFPEYNACGLTNESSRWEHYLINGNYHQIRAEQEIHTNIPQAIVSNIQTISSQTGMDFEGPNESYERSNDTFTTYQMTLSTPTGSGWQHLVIIAPKIKRIDLVETNDGKGFEFIETESDNYVGRIGKISLSTFADFIAINDDLDPPNMIDANAVCIGNGCTPTDGPVIVSPNKTVNVTYCDYVDINLGFFADCGSSFNVERSEECDGSPFRKSEDNNNFISTNNFEINKTKSNRLTISPNPSSGILIIKSEIDSGLISVFNTKGELVFESNFDPKNSYDLSDLSKGVYIVNITNQSENLSERFIIE